MKDNPFDPRGRQRRFKAADLTRLILDRTSGRACGRAESLLADRWDGALEPVAAALLEEHLARCPACCDLAAVLDRLQPLLARFAEREPGPAFTAAVLAATSRRSAAARSGQRRPAPVAPSSVIAGWAQRWRVGWRRTWQRPRFALEAAWTAAALVSLLFWSPLVPAETPAKVGPAVRAQAGVVPVLVNRGERQAAAVAAVVGDAVGAAGSELIAPAIRWARSSAATAWQFLNELIDELDERL